MPISAGDNRQLETVLKTNALPKMNMMLFNILKLLGKREKENFTAHSLMDLVKEVADHETEYKERVQNIRNYLSHLNIDQIVTPVKKVTEFIEGDLLATDPRFMGSVADQLTKVDEEHKKVTNTPEKGKIAWMKIALIMAILGLIIFAVYYLISSGALNNIVPSFGGPKAPDVMAQYGTPEALKAAIDRGEVNYSTLPPDVKTMVDNVKLPEVTPNP